MKKPFATYLLKALIAPLSAMPLCVHYFNARLIAPLIRAFYRRDVVLRNLHCAFPDRPEEEIQDIFRKFYRHFADIFVEAVWFGGCRRHRRIVRSGICRVVNPDLFDEVYDVSKGAMVLYSHAGNWEILGGLPLYAGRPFCLTYDNCYCVYKRLENKALDVLLGDFRTAPVNGKVESRGYIESNDVIRFVLSHRGKGNVYSVNTDQRPYASAKAFITVNFLHRECDSMVAAASLACKCGLPLLYQSMRSVSRGHYEIEYVKICDDASSMSVEDIMKEYYRLLEADIERQPWNYLWTHRRWGRVRRNK